MHTSYGPTFAQISSFFLTDQSAMHWIAAEARPSLTAPDPVCIGGGGGGRGRGGGVVRQRFER